MRDELNQDIRDIQVLRAVLGGQRELFRDIVHRYTDPIYSLSYRMTGSADDAEEAVQEIFSRAFGGLDSFDPDRRFFPWLYTIALNYLRSRERSGVNRRHQQTLSLDDSLEFVVPSSAASQPEQTVLRQEAEKVVETALRSLRREHREVFVLRHKEGLSGREVAEILNIPENTVKTYARRARERLKTLIISRQGKYNEEE